MKFVVLIENSEFLFDEKLQIIESGLLLRVEGSEKFICSSEMLNIEGELGNEYFGSVNKVNLLCYQFYF